MLLVRYHLLFNHFQDRQQFFCWLFDVAHWILEAIDGTEVAQTVVWGFLQIIRFIHIRNLVTWSPSVLAQYEFLNRIIFLQPSDARTHAEANLGLFLGQVAAQRCISWFKRGVVFFKLIILHYMFIIVGIIYFLPLDLK